jgi:hypothetical protein
MANARRMGTDHKVAARLGILFHVDVVPIVIRSKTQYMPLSALLRR